MLKPEGGGNRLLLIDDDALLRGLAAKTLRHAGFDVVEAADGQRALELFEASPFDLLLLDLVMPDLDGYEVCSRVRQLPRGARVPILVLTGLNDTASIELAFEAGATDFIAKPVNWTLLSHRVRYAIRAGAAVESALHSRERLERAQIIANMGSWEQACGGGPFVCSPELARVFAVPMETVREISGEDFLAHVCEADRAAVGEARRAADLHGKPYQLTFGIERFDGVARKVFEQAAPVFDSLGRQLGVEGITQDITERLAAEEHTVRLANFDALTGLPNRQFFGELARPALERSARLATPCALLHLDLDRFKSVNDAVGHDAGDMVLRLIAERLQASTRTADLTGVARPAQESLVARVGANAFTVLLVDAGGERQTAQVAERLLRAVAMPVVVQERELLLSACIGIALYPRDATHWTGLRRCAEQAVYSAKSAGRGQHRFFDEAMNQMASARLAREAALRRGIAEGQLRLHYQAKVDASSGAIIGAEALVRWQHPERGLVLPGEFIALAEETGLILPLTDWVLETACADLRRWADSGLPEVPVSVNLSSASFVHDALPTQLGALLRRHRLSADRLVLEVTESQLMTDVPHAVKRLTELRQRDFVVSLDDFGTGYSSLSYLKLFPIDELKIDRSFVTDVSRGGRHEAIAASVIALGREFGLRVVAEGVETAEQSAFLLAHGCPNQQGYLFARPAPAPAFEALLAGASGLAATAAATSGR